MLRLMLREKNKRGKRQGVQEWRVNILDSVARKDLFEKLTFEPRVEGGERRTHLDIWDGRAFGEQVQRFEAGIYLVCLRNTKETSVIGVGRLVGDEVRDVMKNPDYIRSSYRPLL